jgi:hypothetical protein
MKRRERYRWVNMAERRRRRWRRAAAIVSVLLVSGTVAGTLAG